MINRIEILKAVEIFKGLTNNASATLWINSDTKQAVYYDGESTHYDVYKESQLVLLHRRHLTVVDNNDGQVLMGVAQ
jgi:hypothetical protein